MTLSSKIATGSVEHVKELSLVEVTPWKMTTTSDPGMLSPLSEFWTSPTVIAEVDWASNEKVSLTSKEKGVYTNPNPSEKVKLTSLQSPLEIVGRVRSRSVDECEPWTNIEAPAFDLGISPSKEQVIAFVWIILLEIKIRILIKARHDDNAPTERGAWGLEGIRGNGSGSYQDKLAIS
ncbi:hypothetical protein Ccrd_017017 [Cynara cardunculus var. scolymus]|uniref:Uncharacterized protein n=1 Tax=Cynara cardunculus var. scolymus TaxID=59895 RepID=A0A103Y8U9_CYNCS|nr:hypothetical protein Ccrd_017017 [Cynara cardunculus var. scolymus]